MTRGGRNQGRDASYRLPAPRRARSIGESRPTVGLITAIPEEFVAMRVLLDHGVEAYVSYDPAPYVMGTLPSRDQGQRHQVALTLLGATATNAAANGCANLIRSFPSIVVVVMVGIAAGVPNPSRPDRHVRLGDIVVATQVVDFDHVWATEGGGVKLRRPLSLPSPRLTLGADMLRSDELSGVYPWERWLDLSRCPDLVGYGRPTGHTDVLRDDAGRSLRHPRRNRTGHRKGWPKVHYGTIGSSDRSFNDATVRDRLAAQHGIIAFEMEGAGIGSSSFLNGREWFVVRGISDYGDSHRSVQWRRHAALVAAAYVRALFAKCLPSGSFQ